MRASLWKLVPQTGIILFPWGLTVCYQVIFAKFAIQLLVDIFDFDFYAIRDKEEYTTEGNYVLIKVIWQEC